jgi:Xaa-Pro dipeptidase
MFVLSAGRQMSRIRQRERVRQHRNILHAAVKVHAPGGALAPDTGITRAAERCGQIANEEAIDPQAAGGELATLYPIGYSNGETRQARLPRRPGSREFQRGRVVTDDLRLRALMDAENKAMALLDAIEAAGLIRAGRSEQMVERDIYALADQSFGVKQHWHRRIVRSGINTLKIAADDPPVLEIAEDDTVFLDLGPVFEAWEADVGRTYAIGSDPEKHRLCRDLPLMFDRFKEYFDTHPGVTGAELYDFACRSAEAAGWLFAGKIAGHIVGEFPHARLPGERDHYRIGPTNNTRMRDPDALGQTKFWILEVHLADQARSFGGFYERLLVPAA